MVGLEILGIRMATVLWNYLKGVEEEAIFFNLAALQIVSVEFELEKSRSSSLMFNTMVVRTLTGESNDIANR